MKTYVNVLLFSFTVFCFSCHEPSNNSEPSPYGPFRIKSVTTQKSEDRYTEYRYNSQRQLIEIFAWDSLNASLYTQKFEYNTEGRLSFMSYELAKQPEYNFSRTYSYNENGIIAEQKEFSDLTAATLKSVTTYYRQAYVQIYYYIVTRGNQRDSVVYTGYDRERPSGKRYFTKSPGFDYYLTAKEKFVYDERFNLLQKETTEGNDTTHFKLDFEATYKIINDFRIVTPYPPDNILQEFSPDFPLQSKEYSYEDCGTSVYEATNEILESNAVGLPTRVQRNYYRNYCSVPQTSGSDIQTIIYETY